MKIKRIDDNTSGVHQNDGKKRDPRRQMQIRFNLDLLKPDEKTLADDIDWLKERRAFRPTLLKALALFFSLTDGYLDRLIEYFPQVVQRIQQDYQNTEIAALRAEIEALKRQGLTTAAAPTSATPTGKIKLVKGIQANAGSAFANSIGGYFD